MVDVVDFETKAVPIQAVHFSGDEECAKEIVDWVYDNAGTATWQVRYGNLASLGGIPTTQKLEQSLYIGGAIGNGSGGELPENHWLVLQTDGVFAIYSDASFKEKYVQSNPQPAPPQETVEAISAL
jgi:hypothetical protein